MAYTVCPNPASPAGVPARQPTACQFGCCSSGNPQAPWQCCKSPPATEGPDGITIGSCAMGYLIIAIILILLAVALVAYFKGKSSTGHVPGTPPENIEARKSVGVETEGGGEDVSSVMSQDYQDDDDDDQSGQGIGHQPYGQYPVTLTAEQQEMYQRFWQAYLENPNNNPKRQHRQISGQHLVPAHRLSPGMKGDVTEYK